MLFSFSLEWFVNGCGLYKIRVKGQEHVSIWMTKECVFSYNMDAMKPLTPYRESFILEDY